MVSVHKRNATHPHLYPHTQKESNTPVVGRVYSSTAVRARDTALTVLRALDQPPEALIMTDQLLELDQGEWEGAVRMCMGLCVRCVLTGVCVCACVSMYVSVRLRVPFAHIIHPCHKPTCAAMP